MKNKKGTELLKSIFLGIVWAAGAWILSSILSAITVCTFKDVLFIEGLIMLGIGVLSSISEEELCGSLRGVGGLNYQYISNELQSAKKENRIISLNADAINMDLIIGGTISLFMLII
jgi:hypothetical protein